MVKKNILAVNFLPLSLSRKKLLAKIDSICMYVTKFIRSPAPTHTFAPFHLYNVLREWPFIWRDYYLKVNLHVSTNMLGQLHRGSLLGIRNGKIDEKLYKSSGSAPIQQQSKWQNPPPLSQTFLSASTMLILAHSSHVAHYNTISLGTRIGWEGPKPTRLVCEGIHHLPFLLLIPMNRCK